MDKQSMLRQIADTAYNVGFGAKKHFATYDLLSKAPGAIGFVSTAVGILSLFMDEFSTKVMSATFLILGISALYISPYDSTRDDYARAGSTLTQLFNQLKVLYFQVKSSSNTSFASELQELRNIEAQYYPASISKQIMFSDWYAHYKFFWQHQIEWIDEQKHFKFWRDKVPLSFTMTLILVVAAGAYWLIANQVAPFILKLWTPC